jgi:hypothetical protein
VRRISSKSKRKRKQEKINDNKVTGKNGQVKEEIEK